MKLRLQSRKAIEHRGWMDIKETQMPHPVAQFAMQLIERWGMIAGTPDGEDSAGRMKVRLLAPEEIVARACRTAEIAFEQFAHKDWLFDVPLPAPEKAAEEQKSLPSE